MEDNELLWGASRKSNLLSTEIDKPKLYEVDATPFFWDVTGVQYLDNIKNKLPRIMYYESIEIWGYKPEIYEPEFVPWFKQYYKQLDGNLWVKIEYYNEAYNILSSHNYI